MTELDLLDRKFSIGAPVRYYPNMFNKSEYVDGEIRSCITPLGVNHYVVGVTTIDGVVSVNNLELREE